MLTRLERLLAELKRRNVFRMVGVYALGAWVVIQVADTTSPYLGIPQWVVTTLIVTAAAGLVVTVVLAWAFDLTSEGIRRDPDSPPGRRVLWPRLALPLLVLAVLLTGGSLAARAVRHARMPALDESAAAVLPFRIAGGGATEEGLGEGMVDLLALRLGGVGGMRAVDPRAVISRWRREGGEDAEDAAKLSLRIAREVGAARVITGSLVVTGSRVTIGAKLLRTTGPGTEGRSETVTGTLDSLLYLVDELAVALLAGDAGMESQRVGGLTSLPALQAYLAGKAAHRRGEYGPAVRHFEAALDADSAFALAAMGLVQSAWRSPPDRGAVPAALDMAYRHRGRLGPRDLARFQALVPGYPAGGTILQNVANFERMLARWPDDADAWFELGDRLLHFGRANEIENSLGRAEQALNRAVALDSSFNMPLEHLLLLAFERHDSTAVRALAPRLFALGATGERTGYARWRVGLELADTAAVRTVAAGLDTLPPGSTQLIMGSALWLGTRLEDAERVAARALRDAVTTEQTRAALILAHDVALSRGRVQRARELLDRLPAAGLTGVNRDLTYLTDALFWDGDQAAAEAAAGRLGAVPDRTPATAEERSSDARRECVLGWWELAQGRANAAADRRARLQHAVIEAEDYEFNPDDRSYCVALLDAWAAVSARRPDAALLVARADSIYIASSTNLWDLGNIVTARLRESTGDVAGAFRTIRRTFVGAEDIQYQFVSTYLRETARLAARMGDRAVARDYYRRYLTLRSEADPVLQPDLERVRAELAALLRDRG